MTSVPYGIQQPQVLERVAVDDQQVGDEALADAAEPVLHADQLRPVHRGHLDDLERMEPGLLEQFQSRGSCPNP